ncbi:GEM-like protein 4 [Silene latifolia]|uniref:GEM-like protein 4 n=1 Tax=Silene latifolia TaxID=37657 RepID=UPI003D784CC2
MNISEAFKSRSMKSMLGDHVLRNGLSRLTYDQNTSCNMKFLKGASGNADKPLSLRHSKKESIFSTMNKIVKGKLISGADKVFRGIFSVREGEQLLKASRCCLSTTAGPIAGRLFISTDKVAFCSDRPIAKVSTQTAVSLRFHYKVVIPLGKIRTSNQSENIKKPSQKYLHVVTTDDFEFWFMGFLNYKKMFNYLQQAVSQPYLSHIE